MNQFIETFKELGPFVGTLGILLIVLPFAAAVGAFYLWRIWFSDEKRPRSWILRDLALAATVKTLAAFALGYLAVRRFLGAPPLEEGLLILAFAVIVLEIFPIYYALSAYMRRRT